MDGAPHLPRASGPRELAADYLRIATTGLYDTARYRSPSEARQAVLAAAVSAGLTLPQVLARIDTGVWPGLASFYTRYRHRHTRRKALLADWRNAVAFIAARPEKNPTPSLVRKSPTSEPPITRGGTRRLESRSTTAAVDERDGPGVPVAADLVDRTFVTGTHSLRRPGRHRPPLGAARHGRGGDENRVPVRRVRGALAVGRDRVGPHHRRRAPAGAAGRGRPADRPDRERPRPGRRPVPAADPRRDRRPGCACRVAAREAARVAAGVPGTRPPGRVRLRSPRTGQGPAAQLRPGRR